MADFCINSGIHDALIILCGLTQGSFVIHAGFFHHFTGIWICHIMLCPDTSGSDFCHQKTDDCLHCLRGVALMPPGFSDAVTNFCTLYIFIQRYHVDASDRLLDVIYLDGPLIKIIFAVIFFPLLQNLCGLFHTFVWLPSQIFCHFRVARPVVIHIFCIFYRKTP